MKKGRHLSEEHKRKLCEARKGRQPMLGKYHSEETKKKMSEIKKGKYFSEETRKKISKSLEGHTVSEETKKKLGKAFKGRRHTEESKQKMSESRKGKHHTEDTKRKMSEAQKGKHLSAEHRRKLSDGKKGEKSHFWKGGITQNPDYWKIANQKRRMLKSQNGGSFTLGEWELLKKQYGYTCPICKKREPEIALTIDHIIPLSKGGIHYVENIQPLCLSCNDKKQTQIFRITPEGETMLF